METVTPVPYFRISGELMKKFKQLNDNIDDMGTHMYVPFSIYNDVLNRHYYCGYCRENQETDSSSRPS